jgi:hypothetical protein
LADATYPDLSLAAVASALRDRIVAFAKEPGSTERRAIVVAQLQRDADAYVAAAGALDASADTAVAAGDTAGATATYARLRASEAAFYDTATTKWQRSLLYDLNGYASSVLPTLADTLDPKTGDAALGKLDAAFARATAAASASAPTSPTTTR